MSHHSILCVSTTPNFGCPLDFTDDYSRFGADYGGSHCPEDIPDFIEYNFGDICQFTPQSENNEDKSVNADFGTLVFDSSVNDKLADKWKSFQDKVAECSLDKIMQQGYMPYNLCGIVDLSTTNAVVWFDYEFLTPFEFFIQVAKYHIGKPLYICGCVDFHR